ncbi:MAG: hypothetical protein ACLR7Z_00200 [Bilophila wadsworthia]
MQLIDGEIQTQADAGEQDAQRRARSKSPRETALNTSSDNVFVRCAMLPPSMSEMPTSPKERVTPSNSPRQGWCGSAE